MASGDKVYIADKATLDEVKGKIGSTNDAQSSSTTTGSIFAKLNYLVSQVNGYLSSTYTFVSRIGTTNDAQSSSTTTGSIFAKLNYLVNQIGAYLLSIYNNALKIGTTTDTGGTAITGTVMGKLNYLVSQVSTYLSNIYNNCLEIGTTTDTYGSTSKGTVMGKLNRLVFTSGTLVSEGKYYTPRMVASDITKVLSVVKTNTIVPLLATDTIVYTRENTPGTKIIAYDAVTLNKICESVVLPYTVGGVCLYQDILYCVIQNKIITFNPTTLTKIKEVSIDGFLHLIINDNTLYVESSGCKIVAYDATTFIKKAETSAQQGVAYSVCYYNNTIYYADSTSRKVIVFNATTLQKIGETIAMPYSSWGISVCDDVLYYSDDYTDKITMFDANSLLKIGEVSAHARRIFTVGNTLFYVDSTAKKIIALDTKTLIRVSESTPEQSYVDNVMFVMNKENIYMVDTTGLTTLVRYKFKYSVRNYELGGDL